MITVHFLKQIGYYNASRLSEINRNASDQHANQIDGGDEQAPQNIPWLHFAIWSILGSYIIYFGLGGFLHVGAADNIPNDAQRQHIC